MLSTGTYIDKAKAYRDIVKKNKYGVPYYHDDITYKCINSAIEDCVYFGCKGILSYGRMPVSFEKEEIIEYIRVNHEIGYLIDSIFRCRSEWSFSKLNRNDSFADQWLHDCYNRLNEFCTYLECNLR